MEKTYLIQMAYNGIDGSGINYQYQKAKNKKVAIQKAVKDSNLKGCKIVLISIKRVTKKLLDIVEEHNLKLSVSKKRRKK